MADSRRDRLFGRWLPLVVWAAAIYALSSRPVVPHVGPKLNETDYLFDYLAHAAEFALLCWLAWRAFRGSAVSWLSRRPALWAAVFSAAYAALDEAHQAFVPGRMATLPDWLADITGAALVALAVGLWERYENQRTTPHRSEQG